MKNKFLTSLIVCVLCCPGYAETLHINGTHPMPNFGNYTDVLINGMGTYSLATLDLITTNDSSITINTGLGVDHESGNVTLVADDSFDGVVNANIYKYGYDHNLFIILHDEYIDAALSGNDVLWFNNNVILTNPYKIYDDDGLNSVYTYRVEPCSDGSGRKCIKRYTSTEYNAMQQNEWRETQIALRGAQNNPKVLLQPMTVVNQHELLGAYEFADEVFMSVSPEYYNAKDFHNVGLRLNSGTKIGGRLSIGVGMYATRAAFQNDVSDFKSDVYGGNLRLNYDFDEMFFLRGVMGASFSSINCDGVKNGSGVVSNPNAIGLYAGADFGAKFNFESGLYLSPFVGVATLSSSVVDVHESDSFLRVGNDIGFKYFMDGVTYGYMLRVGVNSYGRFDASVGIGAWTIADKIGGSVSVGFIDTDFGMSGKFSANIRFAF